VLKREKITAYVSRMSGLGFLVKDEGFRNNKFVLLSISSAQTIHY